MENKTEFTHNAKFYGVPCYWNNITYEIQGKNKFYSFLLDIMVWIEQNFPSNDFGFPIQIVNELKENDKWH